MVKFLNVSTQHPESVLYFLIPVCFPNMENFWVGDAMF